MDERTCREMDSVSTAILHTWETIHITNFLTKFATQKKAHT